MFKFIIFSGLIVFCAGKYENITLIDFEDPCTLENGEKGEYATLTNCPEALNKLKLGAKFQNICELSEICWDVVCCHVIPIYGSSYDLKKRLDETCIINATGAEGTNVPIKNCLSLSDETVSRDPICPFTFCENYVCCPHNTTDILEKSVGIDYFKETCIFDKIFDYSLAYEVINCYCKPYFKCDEYAKTYDYENDKFSVNVTLCGYNCCVPMVCCPTRANPSISNYDIIDSKHIDNKRSLNCKDNSSIVESKNQLYLKEIGRIFSVVLGYKSSISSDLIWDCEGVMLTTDTVLATASCLESSINGLVVSIRIGDKIYEVQKIIKHPHYKSQLIYHDIGLLITKEEFKLEPTYNLACLPETRNALNEEKLLAGNADSTKKSLMKVVSANHCKLTINKLKNEKLKYGFVEDIQFCADLMDSNTENCPLKMVGSPLVTQSGVVVGLNVVGRKCENDQAGGLFESIYPYVRWIETNLILSN